MRYEQATAILLRRARVIAQSRDERGWHPHRHFRAELPQFHIPAYARYGWGATPEQALDSLRRTVLYHFTHGHLRPQYALVGA